MHELQIYIAGTGTFAKEVSAFLLRYGYITNSFIDRNQQPFVFINPTPKLENENSERESLDEITILSPSDLATKISQDARPYVIFNSVNIAEFNHQTRQKLADATIDLERVIDIESWACLETLSFLFTHFSAAVNDRLCNGKLDTVTHLHRQISAAEFRANFIVIGAQKCGTTALDRFFRQHQQIAMNQNKDLYFFHHPNLTPNDYQTYHAQYDQTRKEVQFGEASSDYNVHPHIPRNLWNYNPELKLIFILRNPIERAYSAWRMHHKDGLDKSDFEQAISTSITHYYSGAEYGQHRHFATSPYYFNYIETGMYAKQLRRFWNLFPKSQILVLKNEDLRHREAQTLAKVAKFLGVSAFSAEVKNIGKSHNHPPINTDTRRQLQDIYRHDIAELATMLDWDLSEWLN